MDQIYYFITQHATAAPWILFGLFLLAGMNIPISIDILVIIAALLAATIIPELTLPLYFSALLGCYLSAWLAYWLGRFFGKKLLKIKWIATMLPATRLVKLETFYRKHGFLTLLVGRFIPFGVRNGIFMSTGMSQLSFKKFMLRDIFPAFLWTTACFSLFYMLGSNYELLVKYVKLINISIFCAFGVTVIIFICYKRRKNKKNAESDPVK